MSEDQKVQVASKDGMTYMSAGGNDAGPWWAKLLMQGGFLGVLVLVLIGAHDLIKNELKDVTEPIEKISESVVLIEAHAKQSNEIRGVEAEAAKTQANAIDRWVNLQGYRVTSSNPKLYGPPLQTHDP